MPPRSYHRVTHTKPRQPHIGRWVVKELMDRNHASENHSNARDGRLTGRPLVSYVTVSYNSASTIEGTIASIVSCKSHFPCEYIIIDGGSNDGTDEILSRYSQVIDVVLKESDDGIYDAMNKGLRLTRGDYICFVNADDRVIPKSVVNIAKMLRGRLRRLDIVTTAALAIDDKTETLWQPSALDSFLVFRCPNLCHNGVYAHRSVFQRIGDFDSRLKIAADSDWIIRAVRGGAGVKVVRSPTVFYSIGGMSSDITSHANEMLLIAEKTYPLLKAEVIKSLFFHLFAWQERRSMFTTQPSLRLTDAIQEASSIYPELSYWNYLMHRFHPRHAVRALRKLKDSYSKERE
jgi:glycosyltransferase involved in cell wall biosynthesis